MSGGADSVALFRLLLARPELSLHVIHLDHQTRGQASAEDAAFVRGLADQHQVPCTIARRDDIEKSLPRLLPNRSARYRAARMELFRQTVVRERLLGVILAHHADDQAETVLHRLIRGSGLMGLTGMSPETRMGPLLLLRPLLALRRDALREYLCSIQQPWREDASNASDDYMRNRIRRWLQREPELHDALLTLAHACRSVREWTQIAAPTLEPAFESLQMLQLPNILAQESARRWLSSRGAPAGQLSEDVLDRLIRMCQDVATPARQQFPGSLTVRRRKGRVSGER